MRFGSVVSVVLLAACASGTSGSGPAPAPAGQTVRIVGGNGTNAVRVNNVDVSHSNTLPFAPDKVWLALPAVFDSIGVPATTIDPAKRLIGNPTFKVRSRIKSTPLSRYIDCGTGGQIGPNADTYDVVLSVFVEARAGEEGATILTTSVDAVGRPATYAQEYSQCRSKGLLETRLLELLQARLR